MRIPLHLSPTDHSPAANQARYDLVLDGYELNPRGFRQPRTGKHRDARPEGANRITRLGLAGHVSYEAEV